MWRKSSFPFFQNVDNKLRSTKFGINNNNIFMWDFFSIVSLLYYWIFRNKTWQETNIFFSETKVISYQKVIIPNIQLFSRNSRSLCIAIFSIHHILFLIFFFFFPSTYKIISSKTDKATVCRLARRKSSRKIFPAIPWRTVLLGRFHNFPRNRVRFKGTTHPTMKLLALSAEIPSLENLYIYSSFYTLWDEMLLYNLCRYPLSNHYMISNLCRYPLRISTWKSSRFSTSSWVQVFESII